MPYFILGLLMLAFDQWSKYWTITTLELGETAPFLPGFIQMLRLHNYGAAWSSFSGMRWLLVIVTSAIVIAVSVLFVRKIVRHPLGCTAGALIISGGLGNIIDRIRFGYVVDMIHLEFWPSYPVFNIADMTVVCGAILGGVYYLYYYEQYDQVRKTDGIDTTDCP